MDGGYGRVSDPPLQNWKTLLVLLFPQDHHHADGGGDHGEKVEDHGGIVPVTQVVDQPEGLGKNQHDLQQDFTFHIQKTGKQHGGQEREPLQPAGLQTGPGQQKLDDDEKEFQF